MVRIRFPPGTSLPRTSEPARSRSARTVTLRRPRSWRDTCRVRRTFRPGFASPRPRTGSASHRLLHRAETLAGRRRERFRGPTHPGNRELSRKAACCTTRTGSKGSDGQEFLSAEPARAYRRDRPVFGAAPRRSSSKTPRRMNGLWPVSRRCWPIRDSLAGWRSSLLRG
jgi:hypothetical protein